MKKRFQSILSLLASFRMTVLLLMIYATVLGIASFVGKYKGDETANSIYFHPLVGILWGTMIVNWLLLVGKRKDSIRKKFAYYLLHAAFLFIIAGAFISHFFGTEGVLHLREGEQTNEMIVHGKETVTLPFRVQLDDFQITRYSGSNSPRSYSSTLTIYGQGGPTSMEVAMNHVINIQGHRLFQTSYDEDEAGTFISVSHDPAGMRVTYLGYALLLLGILLLPFQKKSRLRNLMRELKLWLILPFFPLASAQAQTGWDEILVQNPNGRVEPMDSYCRSLVRKIHHKESISGIDAIEFVLGLMSNPSYWNSQPIIYQKDREIQKRFGKDGNYLSFNDLLDTEGHYVLAEEISTIYGIPNNQQDKGQKALLKLDEKMNILLSIEQGQMLPIFPLPTDSTQKWYSPGDDLSNFQGEDSLFASHIMPWYFTEPSQDIVHMIHIYQQKKSACPLRPPLQIKLELLYNRIRPFFCTALMNLSCGLLLILFLILRLTNGTSRICQQACRLLITLILLSFAIHTAGLTVRWYVGGQAPWSNAYESMVYAAWCTLASSFPFVRHSRITLAVAAFFSGILLLVSNMNWMDPVITPLVPVLQSRWLMIHVAVIMCGYGFLAIGFLLGLTNLILMTLPRRPETVEKLIRETAAINGITLLLGLCLMTAGTFLGAVWANEAWGRYWGWDPKETWALITIIVYAAITHAHFLPRFNTPYALSTMSVMGFSTVLMTYLGVNCFFSGMHSYGSNNAPTQIYGIAVFYMALFVLCAAAYRRNKCI